MEGFESILPPHWHKKSDGSGYFNDITNEISEKNPISRYFEQRSKYFGNTDNDNIYSQSKLQANNSVDNLHSPQVPATGDDDISNVSGDFHETEREDNKMNSANKTVECKGKSYDYKCQWNERDLFGKVSLFGLTIRYYEDNSTMIKFDGIDGEWVYSSLQGANGPITHHDLFIGAKLMVFGRHLTILSANAASIKWSEKEHKRLLAQQETFRKKILSVGHTPCIRPKEPSTVRHITRDEKSAANVDLRKVLIETAKLGDQLVSLGLAPRV